MGRVVARENKSRKGIAAAPINVHYSPKKQTSPNAVVMSALCQKRTFGQLLVIIRPLVSK